MGETGLERVFWGPIFHSSPMSGRAMVRVAQKERTMRVQFHVGLHKSSSGEFSCTQSLPLGALFDGGKGLGTHFLVPFFHSSPMPGRAMVRVAQEERTRRVQLHVGLRDGFPGEFSCTQSLHLRALSDGRNGLGMRFLGSYFSFVSDAG